MKKCETAAYEKYKALRDARGVTDFKVSRDCGITRSTFTDWRHGRSEPKLQKLIKLAEYFAVPIDALLVDKPQEGRNLG